LNLLCLKPPVNEKNEGKKSRSKNQPFRKMHTNFQIKSKINILEFKEKEARKGLQE